MGGVDDRRDLPGYEDHWLIQQESMAMVQLEQLRRGVHASPAFPATSRSQCCCCTTTKMTTTKTR